MRDYFTITVIFLFNIRKLLVDTALIHNVSVIIKLGLSKKVCNWRKLTFVETYFFHLGRQIYDSGLICKYKFIDPTEQLKQWSDLILVVQGECSS